MENRDIEYFDRLWKESNPKDGMKHTRETWDRLAEGWKKDPPEIQYAKDRQCREMAKFFVDSGVITPESAVIDIGCGTGNYAVCFAEHAKRVTCTDISPKMLEHCREFAKEHNRDNIDFVACDFLEFDIKAAGWTKNFDLVFTSLTPAMDGLESVEKVNAMSRNWCFNNSFVYRKDNLRNAVMENVYGKPVTNRWGNSSTYCLFNILWQMGLKPRIQYYKEIIEYETELSEEVAKGVTINVIRDHDPGEEEIKRTLDYLEKNMSHDGKIKKVTESLFAWTLWNVNGE